MKLLSHFSLIRIEAVLTVLVHVYMQAFAWHSGKTSIWLFRDYDRQNLGSQEKAIMNMAWHGTSHVTKA